MLLFHPISKTFEQFTEVYDYYFEEGSMIETDKELMPGQIVILKGISEYAIVVKKVREEGGRKCFSHDSAEKVVVRARMPRKIHL